MRKAKSLLGLNILSQQEGKHLGTVRDLVFDFEAHKLVALVLTEKDLFGLRDATVIPWSQVGEIGPNAVMVPADDVVLNAHTDAIIAEAFDQKKTLDGKKVTTQGGEDLGRISDLYIDDLGMVQGFEVSGGLFADAFSGKRYMEMPSEITVGEDVVLVPQEIATQLQQQKSSEPGGLSGAYQGAATSVSDTTGSLTTKAGDLYDSAKDKVTDTYSDMANASVDKQREFVIGKTASHDVIIPAAAATMAAPGEATSLNLTSPPAMTGTTSYAPITGSDSVTKVTIEDGAVVTSDGSVEGRAVPTEARVIGGTFTGSELATGVSPATGSDMALMQRPSMASATDVSSTGEIVDGEVLVREGEVITASHADRAISAGVLAKLVAAAAGGLATRAYGSAADSATDHGADAQSKLELAAIGKPSAREISAPDGSIIVAPGQIVTRAILDRADTYGKKNEVIAAAGMGVVSEKAQDTYASATAAAGSLWETIKEKTAELTGSAQDKKADYDAKAEQNKINNALGRPVTRVILSKDDTIILNTGDLITNAAVSAARTADVLDILLDSVYTASPEITPEMLRAQGKGEAALEAQVEPTGAPITATILPDQQAQTLPAQGDPSNATPRN